MPITFFCPSCKQQLTHSVPNRTVLCPKCRQSILVPFPPGSPAPTNETLLGDPAEAALPDPSTNPRVHPGERDIPERKDLTLWEGLSRQFALFEQFSLRAKIALLSAAGLCLFLACGGLLWLVLPRSQPPQAAPTSAEGAAVKNLLELGKHLDDRLEQAKITTAKIRCKNLAQQAQQYTIANNDEPPQSLQALTQAHPVTGYLYAKPDEIIDPWGKPYQMQQGTTPIVVFTTGPNGQTISSADK
jgi:hypothetical protein